MEAWIEISMIVCPWCGKKVASFVEAWIEIKQKKLLNSLNRVASFVEAWIEILMHLHLVEIIYRRLLCGGVD